MVGIAIIRISMIPMPGGISAGEWLMGGATIALALFTATVAAVAYVQLSALRAESRRQRTIELYGRYEGESFVEPRDAARRALEIKQREGIGLRAASQALTPTEQTQFERYTNIWEEVAQQYFAGQLDRGIAEDGLAYLAWYRWKQWREYAYAQRAAQHTRRALENWEDLFRELNALYSEVPEGTRNKLAKSWIAALDGNRPFLSRRLGKVVSKRGRFRVGPKWEPQPWQQAVKKIAGQHEELRELAKSLPADNTPPDQHEYVLYAFPESVKYRAVVVEVRAVWQSRWPHRTRTIRHVVSGFAWFEKQEDALATIGQGSSAAQAPS